MQSNRLYKKYQQQKFITIQKIIRSTKQTHHNIIIKPVGTLCNNACTYCWNRYVNLDSNNKRFMPLSVMETVLKNILTSYNGTISFIWHGGESLLLGRDYFLKVMDIQKRYNKSGVDIENIIQTNGLLINFRWARFFRENNIMVSVSLDSSEEGHNRCRGWNTKATYKNISAKISSLLDVGVHCGIVSTVVPSDDLDAQRYYQFMLDNHIRTVQINPLIDNTDNLLNIETYVHFMQGILSCIIENPDETIMIAPLDDMIKAVLQFPVSACWMNGGCALTACIDCEGNAWSYCDNFSSQNKMGNFMQKTVGIIFEKIEQKYETDIVKRDCRDTCQWSVYCNGGCLHYHFMGERLGQPNFFCRVFYPLFETVETRIKERRKNDESEEKKKKRQKVSSCNIDVTSNGNGKAN